MNVKVSRSQRSNQVIHVGFVTDEISADVTEAMQVGSVWGVFDFELRMVGRNRVPDLSQDEVERLIYLKRDYGIRYTALSPGCFKCYLQDEKQIAHTLTETLPKTFALADRLECPLVIVFGFQRGKDEPEQNETKAVALLRQAAEKAERAGLILAVENELGFWCDSGRNTARILARADHPALRANWDPANAIGSDELPFPDGYETLKPWIVNVHVKDTNTTTLQACVPVGHGKMDWRGQLQALAADGVVPHLTIETHCEPLLENSRRNLETVRRLLHEAMDA